MKNTLFLFLFLPFLSSAQLTFQEICRQTIEMKARFVNVDTIQQDLIKYQHIYYDSSDRRFNKAQTARQLAYLHLELEHFDSAFHFLEIVRVAQNGAMAMGLWNTIKLFDDPRYLVFLDSCLQDQDWINNKELPSMKSTPLVREWQMMEVLRANIGELSRLTNGHPLNLQQDVMELLGHFNAYKLQRYMEMMQASTLPTFSEHGYKVPREIYFHIRTNAGHVLFDRMDELEQLALKGEMEGEVIANMIDQKLIREGKPQRYGTYFLYLGDYKMRIPYPIEEEESVDERRSAIGLDTTLEQYKQMMNHDSWRHGF